jgi:uncharacterized protein
MSLINKLGRNGPKKLLALDGGGIHGLITIEILAKLEKLLRAELGRDNGFVLADYFDYIGGTSTGAMIAACLALGYKVDRVRALYMEHGPRMFQRAPFFKRYLYKYRSTELERVLQSLIGSETEFGDPRLKTLLLIVLRNATTASPWPLSNNPSAKFNQTDLPDCNLKLPLWQLVRASTAAPTYFPPEKIKLGPSEFIFVDGAVSTYNNPAFQLFLMATLKAYRLSWPTGEDRMLLVSVGSGADSLAEEPRRASGGNLLYQALRLPLAFFLSSTIEQDLLCRVFGRCVFGDPIDAELGDLVGLEGEGTVSPKLFTYVRYNVELSPCGLESVGVRGIPISKLAGIDSIGALNELCRIGEATAAKVRKEHLAGFLV